MKNEKRILWPAIFLVGFALTALIPACSSRKPAKEPYFQVTLLHTNDTHAHIVPCNDYGTDCSEEGSAQRDCFGGVARRATKIKELHREDGGTLLLDAGDQFQGTLLHTYYRGQEAVTLMNLLGYDVMALGNHEFDHGPAVLAEFIRGVDFPVVSSNIGASHEPLLAGLVNPLEILTLRGEAVGLIGFITEETACMSQAGPNVVFNKIEGAIAPLISVLEQRGINKIIGLSHSGYKRDQEIAAKVSGLDVIIGGHSHTFLSATDPNAEGPYPTVIDSPRGEPVLVVTAGARGKYLGQLEVTFDREGVVKGWGGSPILLDHTVEQNPEVLKVVMKLKRPLEAFANKVIGKTLVDLDGSRASCRFHECNLGNLIADIMLWKTAGQGTEMALINGGGIRASIKAGEITVGDVLTVLPFSNTLATLKLKGMYIRAALEHGVGRAEDPQNEGTGRFLQVAGLRYAWDPNRPIGSRILSVEKQELDGSYAPLDDETLYTLVTTRFVREGGDGNSVFEEHAIEPYDFGVVLSEAVIDHVSRFSPANPKVEGRITRQ